MLSVRNIRYTCLALLLTALLTLLPVPAGAEAAPPVQIYMQQELQQWEQAPFISQGNTMVPMRALFEKLGFAVTWDAATETATAVRGDLTIALSINKTTATVNGIAYYLETAPMIEGGSTFMPLRFVSESAGADVTWNDEDRAVHIDFNRDPQHRIRKLIDNVTNSSSFIQHAMVITGGDGIKKNDVVTQQLSIAPDGTSAKVTFQAGFTVSKAVKTGSGVTIAPAESVVYEFICSVYKDAYGQWLLRQPPSAMEYVLKENKPF
ncbi:copper amine oxidase N-terminal domain-containing protein [Paenibacillus xerothermodurans]|nr:copper amine oxidase N-terminal domain-containing protein [Paenibacillus xerothermodurans]